MYEKWGLVEADRQVIEEYLWSACANRWSRDKIKTNLQQNIETKIKNNKNNRNPFHWIPLIEILTK